MKRSVVLSLAVTLIMSACLVAQAQTEVHSRNVVGYYTVDIASNGFTMIGIPMEKIPADRGIISDNTPTVITVNNANWQVGQFATGVTGKETYGASTFFLEIATTNGGAFEGRYYTIFTNDANTLTISDSDFADHDLQNKDYKIVAYNRIRDIFGEPTSPVLLGGSSSTAADNIYKWSGISWGNPIYCNTGSPSHWKRGFTTVDDLIIGRDEGVFVNRRSPGIATNITVTGEVLLNSQGIVIGNGFRVIGGGSVIDKTIVDSGLVNVLKGGNDSTEADNIYDWTTSTASWGNPVYFNTNSLHWKRGFTTVDTTFIIQARKSYFINRKGSSTEWMRTSPLMGQ